MAVSSAFAQRTITGTVSDEAGPLPAVNVVVAGTQNGTETDFDGNFTIQADTGDVLKFSYVGYDDTSVKVVAGKNHYDVIMHSGVELETVVVTAQGIKKEKKALGYAMSSVGAEEIKNKPQADVTRLLAGKSTGLNVISQNGLAGSSTKIVVRGAMSFNDDNNALIVVDGIPINSNANASGDFYKGNMGSNRSLDIDPNNIERVDILKGLAATTLYGTAGRNGVILITTKTGAGSKLNAKQEISVSSSLFFNEIASLPDYQNKYGGGFDQGFGWFYSNWGPAFERDALGGWGSDPAFDSDGTLPHPYSTSSYLATNYPDYQALFAGKRYKFKPYNSVPDFFRTGVTYNNAVNMQGRSEDGKYTYGMSFSSLNEDGFTPGNNLRRYNASVGGSAPLANGFKLNGSLNFSRTNMQTPPVAWSGGSSGAYPTIFGDLFYTPRSIDMMGLPYELPDGSSIYYRDDNAIQHPLWTVKNSKFLQLTDHIIGKVAVNYDLNDNMNLMYRAGLDTYSENNTYYQNKGGVNDNPDIQKGFYDTWNNTSAVWSHTVMLSGKKYKFYEDNMNFGFDFGGSLESQKFNQIGITSNDQQVFGFLDHSNYINHDQKEYKSLRNIIGIFGQFTLDYKDFIFLSGSARNDWVSNIYNKSMFYPSASLSFIPTKLVDNDTPVSDRMINYLKLRAGYGTSANFPGGYPTVTSLGMNTTLWEGGVVGNSVSDFRGNQDLRPELFKEMEFGVESKLFKNRVKFDGSYFIRSTVDLIVNQPLPPSSGYDMTQTNIGLIEGNGLEMSLGVDIFKGEDDGFKWNSKVDYSSGKMIVKDLGDNVDFIMVSGFTNLGNGAREGYPLNSMFGARVRRYNGEMVVNDSGSYVSENTDEDGLLPFIGDPNPDYVMNFNNSFSYKGFSLNVLFNHKVGGDVYSQTISALLGRGLTTDTEDRLGTYILPGVRLVPDPADPTQEVAVPNNVQINNSEYYFGNLFATPAEELVVYDGSVIRLQEVSLSYSFDKKLIKRTPFGSVTIKASGYNLWYNAYNTPEGINFDPNVSAFGAGQGMGFDFLTGPSGKKYGFTVSATF